MPRGFAVSEYLDDNGVPWRLRVDADYSTMPDRGWVSGATPDLPPLPREWFPRKVLGVDASGKVQEARIGAVTAALWTGAAAEFQFRASDGAFYFATVIARVGEKRRL